MCFLQKLQLLLLRLQLMKPRASESIKLIPPHVMVGVTLKELGELQEVTLWVVPRPSNSHHQDYYISSRGPQLLGGGTTQVVYTFKGVAPLPGCKIVAFRKVWGVESPTLPETNSLPLKINGWKIKFLLGWHFSGAMLVSGCV